MMSIQTWFEELQASSQKQQQVFMALNIALGVLILVTLISFIHTSMYTFTVAQTPMAPAAHTALPTQSLTKISTWHLFGKYEPNPNDEDIPQTMLNLHLQGIFLSDVPSDSSVVISTNSGASKTYYLNDQLPEGNAVLYRIFGDHVILKFNDRYEALNLPKAEDNKNNNSNMMHMNPGLMPGPPSGFGQ